MPFRVGLLALALGFVASSAQGDDFDSVMDREPTLPLPRVEKTFPPGLADLWLAALDRPDRDTRSRAALAIASAREGGMDRLTAAIGPLMRLLEQPDQHPAVRVAAARALVTLDAKEAAPLFVRLARTDDAELREIVEPALAQWKDPSARDLWLERLSQAPHGRYTLLAIRGLGAVREERAAPPLRELALSSEASPLRLAAAQALGNIRTTGSLPDAERLAPSPHLTDRLVAAALLQRHEGPETVRLLQTLATDSAPSVALVALTRLAQLDVAHIVPVLKPVLASPDAEVRRFGVETLFHNPTTPHLQSLGQLLADPHPAVRVKARQSLRELAKAAQWQPGVLDQGTRALAASDWRGQEQAAILLGQLDHKPAAKRLVELLRSERGEVLVAVGWGLRQLAVADTLAPVLDHVRKRHADIGRDGATAGLRTVTAPQLDQHLSHLVQLLGQARHAAADPVLRAIVPRVTSGSYSGPKGPSPSFTKVGGETRAAAIWALGLLHEGKPEERLVKQIEDRLTGDPGMGPDDPRVRRMAAVSLGRMEAKQSLTALRTHADGTDPSLDPVVQACRWSVARLTGEKLLALGVVQVRQGEWFLAPLAER